jgi:hypothetical protein
LHDVDLHLTQLGTSFIDKHPINALFHEYKERVSRIQQRPALGAYSGTSSRGDEFATIAASSPISLTTSSSVENGVVNDYEVEEESKDGSIRASHRVQSSEKAEAKKRWLSLLDASNAIIGVSRHSGTRAKMRTVQRLLDEAVAIPIGFSSALGSAGSAAQAAEDFASIDRLRSNLGELVRRAIVAREWVAEVRDTLYRRYIK